VEHGGLGCLRDAFDEASDANAQLRRPLGLTSLATQLRGNQSSFPKPLPKFYANFEFAPPMPDYIARVSTPDDGQPMGV
jgi:hypothetical protein